MNQYKKTGVITPDALDFQRCIYRDWEDRIMANKRTFAHGAPQPVEVDRNGGIDPGADSCR